MDGRALFQSVLNPRENLLWVGEPPCASGRRIGAVAIGLLFVFTVALFFWNAPIPPHIGFQRTAALFFGVALFCMTPFFCDSVWSARRSDKSIRPHRSATAYDGGSAARRRTHGRIDGARAGGGNAPTE